MVTLVTHRHFPVLFLRISTKKLSTVSHPGNHSMNTRSDDHTGGKEERSAGVRPTSEMLRLFREGIPTYQPDGLAQETGIPQVALDNINRLRRSGLAISAIHVRPSGALFLFATGEQYYTPALRVGGDGRETEILAEIAADSGWGDLEELLDLYHGIPQDWEGALPDALPGPFDQDGSNRMPHLNAVSHASRHC